MNVRRSSISLVGPIAVALLAAAAARAADAPALPTVGRSEQVWIRDADAVVTARMDSGTRTSSLHVDAIVYYRSNGVNRVRFTFRDDAGKRHTISRPLARIGSFRNNSTGDDLRPVITLGLCIGSIYRRTQVNLVDRGEFTYALLVGRRFLSNRAVVDTSKRLTVAPDCRAAHRPPGSARPDPTTGRPAL